MSYKVKETLKNEEKEMRAVYCKTLCDMAREDSRICALDADLIGSSGMQAFFKEFPDRAVDCGIQEANMVGMGDGPDLHLLRLWQAECAHCGFRSRCHSGL